MLVAGAGWPSALRASVMSAACGGLGMNLLRRFKTGPITNEEWAPQGGPFFVW